MAEMEGKVVLVAGAGPSIRTASATAAQRRS